MIIAFSPEQADEVSRAFGASWWTSDEAQHQRPNDTKSSNPEKDAKPEAKALPKLSPNDYFTNACRYRCRPKQQQHCQKPTKTGTVVPHKSPIHYHEETSDSAKMSLDVTGFDPNTIAIDVENFVVSIRAQRTNKLGDVFSLDRRFRLDKTTADLERVTASFDGGILEITVPKKTKAKSTRRIPIVSKSSSSSWTETSTAASETASVVSEETTVPMASPPAAEHSLAPTDPEPQGNESIPVDTKAEDDVEEEEEEEDTNDNDEEESEEHSASRSDSANSAAPSHTPSSTSIDVTTITKEKSAEEDTWEEVSN